MIKWSLRLSVVLTALVLGIGYGYLASERKLFGYATLRKIHNWAHQNAYVRSALTVARKTGVVRQQTPSPFQPVRGAGGQALTADERKAIRALETVGYLSGYQTAPEMERVTIYDRSRAYNGVNLYTSGHAQEVFLVDMQGELVHKWSFDIRDALPEGDDVGAPAEWWTRTHLFDDGSLIAICTDRGLLKLDKESNPVWVAAGGFHHDFHVDVDGTITALTRDVGVIPHIHEFEPILEDFITVLDRDGNVLRRLSLLEALENSRFNGYMKNMPPHGDVFHANAIEVFDGSLADRSPVFKKGNVLTSFLTMNVIAIVDMNAATVVWALSGQWVGQHHPQLLPSGTMLLFDNRGRQGASKIIEFDPFTQDVVWRFPADDDDPFYTKSYGRVQRLPNGNTLINESNAGRAFEVTPDDTIVWEYYNPARAGEKDELIATLYDFQRVGAGEVSMWLSEAAGLGR